MTSSPDLSTLPLIPRDLVFGNPVKTDPQLSPDGSRMAFIAPRDGVLNVWVTDMATEDTRPVTDDTERGVRVYFWAHDNRHLVYLQDVGGDENWRLYTVDLTTLPTPGPGLVNPVPLESYRTDVTNFPALTMSGTGVTVTFLPAVITAGAGVANTYLML